MPIAKSYELDETFVIRRHPAHIAALLAAAAVSVPPSRPYPEPPSIKKLPEWRYQKNPTRRRRKSEMRNRRKAIAKASRKRNRR